jgi:Domain of unknown function (DUF4232)
MRTARSPGCRDDAPEETTGRLGSPIARLGRSRWVPAYCGLVIALTLAGCGATARSSSGGSARSSGVRPSQPDRPCQSSQLDLALGEPLSEPTGQHSLLLKLTSTSGSRCFLRGYPSIAFYDRNGSALPFAYTHAGDQVVTAQPPTQVNLAPGATAYVAINKYRCDGADMDLASVVSLAPPGDPRPLRLTFGRYPILAYCGHGDPGSRVTVSPVAGSFQETLALH